MSENLRWCHGSQEVHFVLPSVLRSNGAIIFNAYVLVALSREFFQEHQIRRVKCIMRQVWVAVV